MDNDNPNKSLDQKVDEIQTRLSYESLKLWQEKINKEKENQSNPLRSGKDETAEGIP